MQQIPSTDFKDVPGPSFNVGSQSTLSASLDGCPVRQHTHITSELASNNQLYLMSISAACTTKTSQLHLLVWYHKRQLNHGFVACYMHTCCEQVLLLAA